MQRRGLKDELASTTVGERIRVRCRMRRLCVKFQRGNGRFGSARLLDAGPAV